MVVEKPSGKRGQAWRVGLADGSILLRRAAETLPDRSVETRAVVEEALRLYPPLALIARVARNADKLAGTPIGRGAMIVIAPYVLHRHRL
jgi:cytochrome P450